MQPGSRPGVDLIARIRRESADGIIAEHSLNGEGVEAALQLLAAVEYDAVLRLAARLVVTHKSCGRQSRREMSSRSISGQAIPEKGCREFQHWRGVPGRRYIALWAGRRRRGPRRRNGPGGCASPKASASHRLQLPARRRGCVAESRVAASGTFGFPGFGNLGGCAINGAGDLLRRCGRQSAVGFECEKRTIRNLMNEIAHRQMSRTSGSSPLSGARQRRP